MGGQCESKKGGSFSSSHGSSRGSAHSEEALLGEMDGGPFNLRHHVLVLRVPSGRARRGGKMGDFGRRLRRVGECAVS